MFFQEELRGSLPAGRGFNAQNRDEPIVPPSYMYTPFKILLILCINTVFCGELDTTSWLSGVPHYL